MRRPLLFLWLLIVAVLMAGCLSFFAQGYGTLSITSVPAQGRVFLDGEDTGKVTPVVLEQVPAGVRTVRVEFPGMQAATGTVFVPHDGTATLNLTLTQPILSGFVLSSMNGSAVPDATVTLYESGTNHEVASTRTDANGAYTFRSVPDGLYDVVATQATRAEAKAQAVRIENQSPVSVNLVQRKILDPTKEATAPTIEVIGVQAGDLIDQPTTVTVEVEARYPVDRIRVLVGKNFDQSPLTEVGNTESVTFTLDPTHYPNGTSYIAIDTYDYQFNWTRLIVPIQFRNQGPPLPLPRVKDVSLHAVTQGVDIGTFRVQRAELLQSLDLPGSTDLFTLHDGTVINLSELRQDISLYVAISWPRTQGAFAYEVQRAWSESGPWVTIGYRWAHESTDSNYQLIDGDGSLVPGREAFYRVRALGANGEVGEFSTPIAVTPLGRFEVWLVSPADGSTGVSLHPTFHWSHNGVGSNQYFEGYLHETTASNVKVWTFADENITSAPFNYDGEASRGLTPGTEYRWHIYLAYGYTLYGTNSKATAYSLRGLRDPRTDEWIGGGAINGEFAFITTFEPTAFGDATIERSDFQ